jgi:hypothetical protein
MLVLFGAIAAGLVGATHASASVQIASTGEPRYINTTTNTWFVDYVACCDAFRVRFNFGNQLGPLLTEFSSFVTTTSSGRMFDSQSGLVEGNDYYVCATGMRTFGGIGETAEALSSCFGTIGKNASVIVDRTPPNISVSVDGTANYTSNLTMSYHVDYADAIAPPFPANYICRSFDAPGSCAVFNYNAACSVPVNGASRINAFDCQEVLPPTQPDGPVYFCARSADQAVPDIPGNADQFTGSTADKANISAVGCGNVILDRTAPAVSTTANGVASAVAVKAGDLVSFAAQASDATSGVGALSWTFGDNTAGGSGAAVTHTYTQAGTFQATVSTADGAGNAGTSKVTVTVTPQGGATGSPGNGSTTTPPPGGATGSTGNGSTTTIAPTPTQISQQVGGGGTQKSIVAGLDIIAPKRIKIAPKLKAVPLALTASGAGKMTVALLKGTRIVARGGVNFTRPGTAGFKLKLPRKLAPGLYKLKITFTPAGATVATTKTMGLRFTGGARIKSIASGVGSVLRGSPSLTPPSR